MQRLSDTTGDTYYFKEEIIDILKSEFKLILEDDYIDNLIKELVKKHFIIIEDGRYYLSEIYYMETSIAYTLKEINEIPVKN
jgi:hypothetical protein